MNPIVLEVIGILSSLIILISMLFKTTSFKGSLTMRILNLCGSIVFVIYGCLLPAVSTAVLNTGLELVNAYHIVLLIKDNKNNQ